MYIGHQLSWVGVPGQGTITPVCISSQLHAAIEPICQIQLQQATTQVNVDIHICLEYHLPDSEFFLDLYSSMRQLTELRPPSVTSRGCYIPNAAVSRQIQRLGIVMSRLTVIVQHSEKLEHDIIWESPLLSLRSISNEPRAIRQRSYRVIKNYKIIFFPHEILHLLFQK